ncbi:MAG: hypothetical protein U5N85_08175 [Arcicella sp.]|nr:hypothetical protein [Arcicella sp.]
MQKDANCKYSWLRPWKNIRRLKAPRPDVSINVNAKIGQDKTVDIGLKKIEDLGVGFTVSGDAGIQIFTGSSAGINITKVLCFGGNAGAVGEVAKAGEAAEMVSIYRGVNSTSPAFAAAENGVVKSRGGILGHSDALTHNTGANGTANSKMTSWTTNPEVAKNFALRTSGNGVVLSQQVPASSLITSPNLKTVNLIQGGGRVSESEVLLRGTQRNLNVQRIGQ